jgi:hypothetical protein
VTRSTFSTSHNSPQIIGLPFYNLLPRYTLLYPAIPYCSPGKDVDQFWVDRQSFKQEDNIYYLVKVQINKLNAYLQFKLNYDVCYTYESCLYIFPIIKLN